jgi:DNA-binding CsgD family transcriptional regulator
VLLRDHRLDRPALSEIMDVGCEAGADLTLQTVMQLLVQGELAAAGLACALEAIRVPSFIARRDGRIDHSNEAGASLVAREPHAARESIRRTIAQSGAAALVSKLNLPGIPECFLVVLRDEDSFLSQRLRTLRGEWKTTPAESAVLRWLVTGDSNKEIAIKLDRSEVSVERAVTSLLRKSMCGGRARLVANFWQAR